VTAAGNHGAAMDGIYRFQRHFYDVTRRYYLLGRDRLIAHLAVPHGGTVLEIGCGTARNLIRVAQRHPDCLCYGLDISSVMLAKAQANVDRAGLDHRIVLARADATDFDAGALFGQAAFDRVYASYTLSMIPDWRAAMEQACQALRPGGSFHIVDFGQQERLPDWFKALLRAWLDRFSVTPRAALIEHGLNLAAEQAWLGEAKRLYRGYAWAMVLTRPVNPTRQDSRSPSTN
jgi:S-adenosylmethionine-diacylgycerolhomoserine-N-methlytransferase